MTSQTTLGKASDIEHRLLAKAVAFNLSADMEDGELSKLMRDEWLRKKLNRTRRIKDHIQYLLSNAPELFESPAGVVVDLGPGDGVLLEIAREAGHTPFGVDAPSGEGGMGQNYYRACQLIHNDLGLTVVRTGALNWLKAKPIENMRAEAKAVLINSRGSLEQIFAPHLDGPPHHLHHDASKLSWRINDKLLASDLHKMFRTVVSTLRDDGSFLIHMNGAANTCPFESLLDKVAGEFPLVLEKANERLRKWSLAVPQRAEEKENVVSLDAVQGSQVPDELGGLGGELSDLDVSGEVSDQETHAEVDAAGPRGGHDPSADGTV